MLSRAIAFGALCAGFFIVMMDTTAVPLLYPTLIDQFGIGPAEVSFVHNVYLLTFAAFLLPGGRLGDQLDRKAVVLSAFALIAVGSIVAGSDRALFDVVAGRALMGAGAGLLAPQSMAYITTLFEPGKRGKAFGIWGAIAGVATATGPVITQSALNIADWRWVMWINAPLAAVAFVLALAALPSVKGSGWSTRATIGSVLVGGLLGGLTLGLQLMSEAGQLAPVGGTLAGATLLGLIALTLRDLKRGSGVILPPALWEMPSFLRVSLISGLLGFGLTSFYLPLSYLLGARYELSPVMISTLMVTIALTNALVGPFAGKWSDRIAPEHIVRGGLVCFVVACAALGLTGLTLDGLAATAALFAAMGLAGIGTGLAFAPLANLALSAPSGSDVGRAAAFFNATRQGSSALGGVLIAGLFELVLRPRIGSGLVENSEVLRANPQAVALASGACLAAVAAVTGAGALLSHPQPARRAEPFARPQHAQ